MELENQVCSLELAEKLKKLGVNQESLFWWANEKKIERVKNKWKIVDKGIVLGHYGSADKSFIDTEHYSAFTVAELGEMLPKYIGFTVLESTYKLKARWAVWYRHLEDNTKPFRTFGKTEADARAKMLVYLLENKLVKVEEINGGEK